MNIEKLSIRSQQKYARVVGRVDGRRVGWNGRSGISTAELVDFISSVIYGVARVCIISTNAWRETKQCWAYSYSFEFQKNFRNFGWCLF